MDPAIITLCVLAVAAFLFVTELIPLAVTAMAACTALGILGVLPSKQVYAGLSNSTVVLFGGMFVIGAAMFKTGLAETIGIAVVKKAGTNEIPLMAAIMTVTIVLSAVSSNTGTVACLMPVIIGICQAAKIAPSKELMPLAIAANVGGTITMIGTPPNVIVTGALTAAGLPTFGFFEFAYIGVPLSIIFVLYTLFVGRHFIPAKSGGDMDEDAVKAAAAEAGASDDGEAKSKAKMWISGLILLGVVACMALGLKNLPLHTAAVTGAILCVVTGCLKEKEAYAGIDWVTIFLFAGMLSVATAMEKTGAGKLIADIVVNAMGDNPNPYVLCAVLFLISNVLTQFMSNTASAALLAPIGISIAQSIG
ncbi:MAG: SLC13 family permease, partial [Dialister sp.]|nr:SLC13 family permease [Dialister sp.]